MSRPVTALLRHGLPLLFLTGASACASNTPPAAVTPAAPVFEFARLADSIVNSPPLHRAHIGIEVYDPATGRVLYQHNAERRFVPASNQKLWVTATALHELGPDFRYRTPILAVGADATSGAARAVIVVGRGDPTFSARFHRQDDAVFRWLADSIAAAGIRHITGDLIIDASYFDRAIIPGTWTYGNLNGTSAPPTGAFVFAEGIFRVAVRPAAAAGAAAEVEAAAPAGVVPVVSSVRTVAAGTNGSTSNSRGPWSDTLRISGSIPVGAEPRSVRLPMTDPVRFAAHALGDALRARGITIGGGVRIVHDADEAAELRAGRLDPSAAALTVREIAAWTSPPMSEIVASILGPSQNWIAEQLVRTLGAEKRGTGSWGAGLAVQRQFLFGVVGIDSTALRLNDGSGMSNQNLVTPHGVVQLLNYARTAAWGPEYRAALAGPGRPGTLSSRLRGLEGRMEGKTGTLSSVNALSGYVRTNDGRELIFSILSNASNLGSGPVVSAMDVMVAALANGHVPR